MIRTYITCDKCNPTGSTRTTDGVGYAYISEETAFDHGWLCYRIDGDGGKHMCPECVEVFERSKALARLSSARSISDEIEKREGGVS
jgi:hypothetical protein